MFEINGLEKKTLKTVLVAIAQNMTELKRILNEAHNSGEYYSLRYARLRFAQ